MNDEAGYAAPQKTNVIEVLKGTLKRYDVFEQVPDLFARAAVIKRFMRENLAAEPLEDGQKYGVVCHSMLIANLTASELDPDPSNFKGVKGYTWAENCQMVPFTKFERE